MLYRILLLAGCLLGVGLRIASPGRCPIKDGVMVPVTAYDGPIFGTNLATVKIQGSDSLVLSATDGRVRDAIEGGDRVAIVKDTATYTYFGLDRHILMEGQLVKAGQVIGFAKKKRVFFFVSNYLYTHINPTPQIYVDCVCKLAQP